MGAAHLTSFCVLAGNGKRPKIINKMFGAINGRTMLTKNQPIRSPFWVTVDFRGDSRLLCILYFTSICHATTLRVEPPGTGSL